MGCCQCMTKCRRRLKLMRATRVHPELARKLSIKEVYNLFIILDYLPLHDLIRLGRVSR